MNKDDIFLKIQEMKISLEKDELEKLYNLSKEFKDIAFDFYHDDICLKKFEEEKHKVKSGGYTAHGTHCCKDHGCKYGEDKYCTVVQELEEGPLCPASTQCPYDDYDHELY